MVKLTLDRQQYFSWLSAVTTFVLLQAKLRSKFSCYVVNKYQSNCKNLSSNHQQRGRGFITDCITDYSVNCTTDVLPDCTLDFMPDCKPAGKPDCKPDCTPDCTPDCKHDCTPDCTTYFTTYCTIRCTTDSRTDMPSESGQKALKINIFTQFCDTVSQKLSETFLTKVLWHKASPESRKEIIG